MITVSVEGSGVARIRFDSPTTRNAISGAWGSQFRAAAENVAATPNVRAIVIEATGPYFSVGGDLSYFADAPDRQGAVKALANDIHAAILSLTDSPAPTIASVQGPAAGAGLSIVLAADFAVAAASAWFVVGYTAVGLSLDAGSSYWLPRRVGARTATELAFTNRRVAADEAARIGIVTEVADDEPSLRTRVSQLAKTLSHGPASSHDAVKKLFRTTWDNTLEQQLAAEASAIAELAGSVTGAEGITAFLEGRSPRFGTLRAVD